MPRHPVPAHAQVRPVRIRRGCRCPHAQAQGAQALLVRRAGAAKTQTQGAGSSGSDVLAGARDSLLSRHLFDPLETIQRQNESYRIPALLTLKKPISKQR